MAKEKQEEKTAKLTVVKNEEPKEETKPGKPTPEEVAQYKADFDAAMKDFAESRFAISDVGQFPANDTIQYWIVAYDTANNVRVSDVYSFTIQS